MRKPALKLITVLALSAALAAPALSAPREIVGHAIVREDGSLLIQGQVVHLYGIYLPETERQCRQWINPIRCDERGVLALDFKVSGFIHCLPQRENPDGSLSAVCYVGRSSFDPGEDLGAYLIRRGWALARPEAPFEYQAMERIARERGLGVWGWPVDSVSDPVFPRDQRTR